MKQWMLIKRLGFRVRQLSDMSYDTLKIPEGEELLDFPKLHTLLYYEAERLGLDTNQSYFGKDKKGEARACWLDDFDSNSGFLADSRSISNNDALRVVITKKKKKTVLMSDG